MDVLWWKIGEGALRCSLTLPPSDVWAFVMIDDSTFVCFGVLDLGVD